MKKSDRSRSKKIPQLTTEAASAKLSATASPEIDKELAKAAETGLYPFDSRSISQLAVGSAVVIATLLSVPDGVALIPGATSIVSWTLRLIGNWVIGAVLWFVGFGAIAQLLRLISRGVSAGDSGLKLSRFDRLIAWDDIQAITLEPNQFFTRLFALKEPARKLTILFRFTAKNKLLANLLFPNFIPSFFFSKPVFDALIVATFAKSGILPADKLPAFLDADYAVTAMRAPSAATVRNTSNWLNKQRWIVTIVVALSLTLFLGRKAAVNYAYNSGIKAYGQGKLEEARDDYKLAISFEPTFAAGWNGLATTEFHLAEQKLTGFDLASRYWKRALLCKPDYVEPRLGLIRLAFYQRHFVEASDRLEHAVGIAPNNLLVNLENAEYAVRRGRPALGLSRARLIVTEAASAIAAQSKISGTLSQQSVSEYTFLAHCLIAQAKLDLHDATGAFDELKNYTGDAADYRNGENITYLFIVKSRILSAQKQYDQALKLAERAVLRQPRNEEALVQAALCACDVDDSGLADSYIQRARALNGYDPWIYIAQARRYGRANAGVKTDSKKIVEAYKTALAVPDQSQDAVALRTIYNDLSAPSGSSGVASGVASAVSSGDTERAGLIASARQRALQINPDIFK